MRMKEAMSTDLDWSLSSRTRRIIIDLLVMLFKRSDQSFDTEGGCFHS